LTLKIEILSFSSNRSLSLLLPTQELDEDEAQGSPSLDEIRVLFEGQLVDGLEQDLFCFTWERFPLLLSVAYCN